MPQFISFVLHRQPLVQIGCPDTFCLAAHGHDRRKALARQKIAAAAGQKNRNGNQPCEHRPGFLHHLFLRMKRLQNDQCVGFPFG